MAGLSVNDGALAQGKVQAQLVAVVFVASGFAFTDGSPHIGIATKRHTDGAEGVVNGFRTNFEYASVGLFLIYVLQIVDATVDAHLFYFDISDDLSLNIKPSIWPSRTQTYSGINLTLNLK